METDSYIKPPNEFWRNAILPEASMIKDAVENLNNSSMQIVLVVNDKTELVGTISDGDIRRGLLKDLTLQNPITEVIQRNPVVVGRDATDLEVKNIMASFRIHHVPIVDQSQRLLGVHHMDSAPPDKRSNIFVIMAGGLGSRLMPYTNSIPKGLLTVSGKPMLEHIITRAKLDGFHKFKISIHYLGEMIEDYFGDGSNFGVEIEYIRETSPLGTAGSLSLLTSAPDEPFVVSNCDVMTDISYRRILDYHLECSSDATMAVRSHAWQHPFGVVTLDGLEITGIEEKPIAITHINAGVYVLNPSILELLELGTPCDMTNLFNLIRQNRLTATAFPIHERWMDIGNEEQLIKASE